MKIAYLTQSYPPMISGAALVVQRQAQGMANAGHDVIVLCASDKVMSYRSHSENFEVIHLRSLRNPLRVKQRFGFWSPAMVAAHLKAFQPQIVHFHDSLFISGLSASRRLITPPINVLTIHQLPWFVSSYLPALRRPVESVFWEYGAWLNKSFDEVITPSETVADMVCVHTKHRPLVISNGIDLEHFNPLPKFNGEGEELRRKYQLDADLPVILYVGRIDTDKQVDLLVQAVGLALKSVKAQLFIVGDGTELKRVIDLTKELGIHHLCHFPGFISPEADLPGIYRLGSVFCTASVIEIQSSVVLEAEATGLPVVAFQASSMPELISDGESGYLVPVLDIAGIADRIVTLIQNPTKRATMGLAGLQNAQKHSSSNSIRAHIALFESLVCSSLHEKRA
jgi:1,2-diacylglycerol 3-alpha-glucosyltransferase